MIQISIISVAARRVMKLSMSNAAFSRVLLLTTKTLPVFMGRLSMVSLSSSR